MRGNAGQLFRAQVKTYYMRRYSTFYNLFGYLPGVLLFYAVDKTISKRLRGRKAAGVSHRTPRAGRIFALVFPPAALVPLFLMWAQFMKPRTVHNLHKGDFDDPALFPP